MQGGIWLDACLASRRWRWKYQLGPAGACERQICIPVTVTGIVAERERNEKLCGTLICVGCTIVVLLSTRYNSAPPPSYHGLQDSHCVSIVEMV